MMLQEFLWFTGGNVIEKSDNHLVIKNEDMVCIAEAGEYSCSDLRVEVCDYRYYLEDNENALQKFKEDFLAEQRLRVEWMIKKSAPYGSERYMSSVV